MGKDKDFSLFIKSGHALYRFFLLFIPIWKHSRRNGKIKLTEKLAILQYTYFQ